MFRMLGNARIYYMYVCVSRAQMGLALTLGLKSSSSPSIWNRMYTITRMGLDAKRARHFSCGLNGIGLRGVNLWIKRVKLLFVNSSLNDTCYREVTTTWTCEDLLFDYHQFKGKISVSCFCFLVSICQISVVYSFLLVNPLPSLGKRLP